MTPPRWLKRASLLGVATGLALVLLGPVLVFLIARSGVDPDAGDPTRQFEQARDAWWFLLYWTTPIGMGLLFSSVIALLFLWVTRVADQSGAAGSRPGA